MAAPLVAVRPLEDRDRDWAHAALTAAWGSSIVVSPGGLRDASLLPGLVAELDGQLIGLLTYAVDDDSCEVVTIDALRPGMGVGTALLDAVKAVASAAGCRRVWLTTTNDNTPALRFYQRRGWNLVALHRDVIAEWRQFLKPSIAQFGHDDIPIRHALELEILL
jgi:ribosomal protein S18 acetylase RimI-like enzyme